MSYQIDFLPIGEKACGDSIAVRFGDLDSGNPAQQTTILIDGGFSEDHEQIKRHFQNWFGSTRIDLMISTHPDQDHVNGLKGVIENMDVRELWMHLPWLHYEVFEESRQENFNVQRLSNRLAKALQSASDLAALAKERVPIVREPFSGEIALETPYAKISVAGPSRDYYESLLPQFIDWQPKPKQSYTNLEAILKGIRKAAETLDIETLKDNGETSPQNNSSVITLVESEEKKFLFPGDAGRDALELACEELKLLGHQPASYTMVQIPHHGSRRNVGPTVLNRLLGEKRPVNNRGYSYVSASKECEDHPKKVVMNAFNRRGYPVISTEGISQLLSGGAPDRGWGQSAPHPLYSEVEEDE